MVQSKQGSHGVATKLPQLQRYFLPRNTILSLLELLGPISAEDYFGFCYPLTVGKNMGPQARKYQQQLGPQRWQALLMTCVGYDYLSIGWNSSTQEVTGCLWVYS